MHKQPENNFPPSVGRKHESWVHKLEFISTILWKKISFVLTAPIVPVLLSNIYNLIIFVKSLVVVQSINVCLAIGSSLALMDTQTQAFAEPSSTTRYFPSRLFVAWSWCCTQPLMRALTKQRSIRSVHLSAYERWTWRGRIAAASRRGKTGMADRTRWVLHQITSQKQEWTNNVDEWQREWGCYWRETCRTKCWTWQRTVAMRSRC